MPTQYQFDVASGSFATAANWAGSAVPAAGDDALILANDTATVSADTTVNSLSTQQNGVLQISNGATQFSATNGTVISSNDYSYLASANSGQIYVGLGATLAVGNTFDNIGDLTLGYSSATLAGAPAPSYLKILGTVTLTHTATQPGGGVVNLGAPVSEHYYPNPYSLAFIVGGALTNVNNAISGSGAINVSNLDNQAGGTIVANQPTSNVFNSNNMLVLDCGVFTNEGFVGVDAGSALGLGLDKVTLSMTNTGTISVAAGGELLGSGNFTISGNGQIANAGTILVSGATPTAGTTSTLTINSSSGINNVGGVLEAAAGGTLVLNCNVATAEWSRLGSPPTPGGTIEAMNGGFIRMSGTINLGPGGSPGMNGTFSISPGQVIVDAGGQFEMLAGSSIQTPVYVYDQNNDYSSNLPQAPTAGVFQVDAGASLTGPVTLYGGTLKLNGTGTPVNVVGNGRINLNNASVSLSGPGGSTIDCQGTENDKISLSGTVARSSDAVVGTGEYISLLAIALQLTGGGNTVYFVGDGDALTCKQTNFAEDFVYGVSGTVYLAGAQAAVIGGAHTVFLDGSSSDYAALYNTGDQQDVVNGSNGVIILNDAQAAVVGGSNYVYFNGTGNYASLYNTGANEDIVNGSNGVVILNSAQAAVVGGSNAVYFNGAGDYASLFNTGANQDVVYGSNGVVILNSAQAAVVGGSNSIYFNGAGDYASLYNTGGNQDIVNGSNGVVILNNAHSAVVGNSDALYMSNNSVVTQGGSFDTYVFQQNPGNSTIAGWTSNDVMQLSAAEFSSWTALTPHIAQVGANTMITMDANDVITLLGVNATSLTQSQFRFA